MYITLFITIGSYTPILYTLAHLKTTIPWPPSDSGDTTDVQRSGRPGVGKGFLICRFLAGEKHHGLSRETEHPLKYIPEN